MERPTQAPTFLFLAGIANSGPDHWQRRFASRLPNSVWVEHADWDKPSLEPWLRDLDATLAGVQGPMVVVAHSLGCLLLCAWAEAHPDRVLAGAFCVAPPDPAAPGYPQDLAQNFEPGDRTALHFPAVVLASQDDPCGSLDYAGRCAVSWGATLLDMGAHGHLNAASLPPDWPEGWQALQNFLVRLGLR